MTASPLWHFGRPARLLVGLLAWPLRTMGRFSGETGRPGWLLTGQRVTFVRLAEAEEAEGGCVVKDAAGHLWTVPVGFLGAVGEGKS